VGNSLVSLFLVARSESQGKEKAQGPAQTGSQSVRIVVGTCCPQQCLCWLSSFHFKPQVIPIATHLLNNGSGVGVLQCLEHMIGAVRSKVAEVRKSDERSGEPLLLPSRYSPCHPSASSRCLSLFSIHDFYFLP